MSQHLWVAQPDTTDNDGSWEVRDMLDESKYVLIAYGLTEKVARLIASAPDLLEACKSAAAALAPFSSEPAEKSLIARLRAAIAKAEGPAITTPKREDEA